MRVRGTVAYEGTAFHGWAAQPGLSTVQGVLEAALERVLGTTTPLIVAGRTDAGVHARGQVISFDADDGVDLGALRRSLDRLAGPDVAVHELAEAAVDFSARFSARSRRYLYRYLTTPAADPFRRRYAWHVAPLDVDAMSAAASLLVGEHDFAAFCKVGAHGGTVRQVSESLVEAGPGGEVRFWVEAASFAHQMVRSFAGALAAVGHGRQSAEWVGNLVESADRAGIGNVAPACGLTLWLVRYTATAEKNEIRAWQELDVGPVCGTGSHRGSGRRSEWGRDDPTREVPRGRA